MQLLLLLNIFQGNIAAWLKKVGDKISPGDAIAELETDKVRAPRQLPLLHAISCALSTGCLCLLPLTLLRLCGAMLTAPAGDARV